MDNKTDMNKIHIFFDLYMILSILKKYLVPYHTFINLCLNLNMTNSLHVS